MHLFTIFCFRLFLFLLHQSLCLQLLNTFQLLFRVLFWVLCVTCAGSLWVPNLSAPRVPILSYAYNTLHAPLCDTWHMSQRVWERESEWVECFVLHYSDFQLPRTAAVPGLIAVDSLYGESKDWRERERETARWRMPPLFTNNLLHAI